VPGRAFFAERADACALRLSFAAPGIDDIVEGAKRMKRAYDEAGNASR
jgi:DNA-binding transcriptional MocR family regulator